MGEMEEKLNAILSDQSAMGQIMALAQSLGGKGGGAPEAQPPDLGEGGGEPPSQERTFPAAMGGGSPLAALGDLDPRLIQMGMRMFQEYQGQDDRTLALLNALRPFVKEERYAKLDRAMQISRLSRVIRALFDTMGKGGEGRV